MSTPLHEAVNDGDSDAVRRLIDQGADIEQPDPEGRTPLITAARTSVFKTCAAGLP